MTPTKMSNPNFKYDRPRRDLRHFVNEEDVETVLSRLPSELSQRLKRVYFKTPYRRGILGWVTRGKREIVLCAIPPRISLTNYLTRSQNPTMFGAVRNCQWPTLAIRRFMLYDVLLHELGHLQEVHARASNPRRKFAQEPKAQGFAETWCARLWAEPLDHPDPVHNPPSVEETEMVENHWPDAHLAYKRGLEAENRGDTATAFIEYEKAVDRFPSHALALEALGISSFDGYGGASRAIGFLTRALETDPALCDANLFMALAVARLHRDERARVYFEKALELSFGSPSVLALYGRVLGEWGHLDEAMKLFKRALSGRRKDDTFLQHHYKMFLRSSADPAGKKPKAGEPEPLFDDEDWRIIQETIGRGTRTEHVRYGVASRPQAAPSLTK